MNFQELMNRRVHRLSGEVNLSWLNDTASWLGDPYGDLEKKGGTILVSTKGGDLNITFGVIDLIRLASQQYDLCMLAVGVCMSSGVCLMTAVEPDKRYASANTRFMVHAVHLTTDDNPERLYCAPTEPVSLLDVGREGDFNVQPATLREAYTAQDRMIDMIVAGTRLTNDALREMLVPDTYFWADRAQEIGLIGHIL